MLQSVGSWRVVLTWQLNINNSILQENDGGDLETQSRTSLVAQWPGRRIFLLWAYVQPLVGELRSYKLWPNK